MNKSIQYLVVELHSSIFASYIVDLDVISRIMDTAVEISEYLL